jgi:hypothetical protein
MTAPYLLVLAHQRSGSNHLFDLLRGFEGVTTLGEFFNITASAPGKMHQADALAQFNGSVEQFTAAAENNPLDTLRFRDNIADTDLFVIKLFGNQLRSKRARRILIDNAVGVIHLRRNVFATWVSREFAKKSGQWFNESRQQTLVTFSPTSFVRYASKIVEFARDFALMLKASGRPFIEMTFSEVSAMQEPRQVAERLSGVFAGLPDLVVRDDWQPLVSRQDPRLPIERIENPDEAKATLTALGIEYLLDDNDTNDTELLHKVLSRRRAKTQLREIASRLFRR